MTPITIEVLVNAPIEKVWGYWNSPEHIEKWATASDDWETTNAENDLRTGGRLMMTMGAKDKSQQFDLIGVYSAVTEHELIEYDMEDGRHVTIAFSETPEGVKIVETFDPENENSEELQRSGWQAILDNFKKHVENN